VYPAVLLIYFISAAAMPVVSLALMVQFSLPYNKVGRAAVLYNIILVFFGLNPLFIMPVISDSYLICYQCPFRSHNISNFVNS
jgi:hypothetical protein